MRFHEEIYILHILKYREGSAFLPTQTRLSITYRENKKKTWFRSPCSPPGILNHVQRKTQARCTSSSHLHIPIRTKHSLFSSSPKQVIYFPYKTNSMGIIHDTSLILHISEDLKFAPSLPNCLQAFPNVSLKSASRWQKLILG